MPFATTLLECLSDLPDPRVERTRRPPLVDSLVLAVCAFVCGAEGWDDSVEFAHAKPDGLQERLQRPNGLACADTFRRVLARLDPDWFPEAFVAWIQAVQKSGRYKRGSEVIAVDAKTFAPCLDTASAHAPIPMVRAWASGVRLGLGQGKGD